MDLRFFLFRFPMKLVRFDSLYGFFFLSKHIVRNEMEGFCLGVSSDIWKGPLLIISPNRTVR